MIERKGPKADIIQQILEQALFYPQVPQRDIQMLLWAIIARTEYERMPKDMQRTASTLLTHGQLVELNGGPLSLLPEKYEARFRQKLDQQLEMLTVPLQRIVRAELQLRQQITQSATYRFCRSDRPAV